MLIRAKETGYHDASTETSGLTGASSGLVSTFLDGCSDSPSSSRARFFSFLGDSSVLTADASSDLTSFFSLGSSLISLDFRQYEYWQREKKYTYRDFSSRSRFLSSERGPLSSRRPPRPPRPLRSPFRSPLRWPRSFLPLLSLNPEARSSSRRFFQSSGSRSPRPRDSDKSAVAHVTRKLGQFMEMVSGAAGTILECCAQIIGTIPKQCPRWNGTLYIPLSLR